MGFVKLELRTDICQLIYPDTYGSELCYEIKEGMESEFWELTKQVADGFLNGLLKDTILFSAAKITVTDVRQPMYYNFETDSLVFEIEFGDWVIGRIAEEYYCNQAFFDYCKKEFGTRDGFVSFYPVEAPKFFAALTTKPDTGYDLERAVAMVLNYEIAMENDLDEVQRNFENEWYDALHMDGDILIDDEDDEEDLLDGDLEDQFERLLEEGDRCDSGLKNGVQLC